MQIKCHKINVAVEAVPNNAAEQYDWYSFFFFDGLLTVLHLSIFVSVINQLDAQNFCFTVSFISCLYMFRAPCAYNQEVKIALHGHL